MMLHDGQDTAGEQPFRDRAADYRDGVRVTPVGPVADDLMRSVDGNVEHRRAIDIDADGQKIMRHQAGAETRNLAPDERIVGVDAPVDSAGRIPGPMRRAHALDAPAFLIDENRCFGPPDGLAQGIA